MGDLFNGWPEDGEPEKEECNHKFVTFLNNPEVKRCFYCNEEESNHDV
jgi:hypothetical protein